MRNRQNHHGHRGDHRDNRYHRDQRNQINHRGPMGQQYIGPPQQDIRAVLGNNSPAFMHLPPNYISQAVANVLTSLNPLPYPRF